MFLAYLYLLTIATCLVFSIQNRLARQRHFWFYFSIVLIIETTKIFRWGNFSSKIYAYGSLVYILYFLYYYLIIKINKFLISSLVAASTILCFYFIINSNKDYPIAVGVLMSLVYIILSLTWFINQIIHTDSIKIANKQAFWNSFSLLTWSTFFLFRLIPMYWLNLNDNAFLEDLNFGYQIITIASYFIFLRGLFCKF